MKKIVQNASAFRTIFILWNIMFCDTPNLISLNLKEKWHTRLCILIAIYILCKGFKIVCIHKHIRILIGKFPIPVDKGIERIFCQLIHLGRFLRIVNIEPVRKILIF